MNTLSWFLYIAEVFGNLGWMFNGMFFVSSIAALFAIPVFCGYQQGYDETIEGETTNRMLKKFLKFSITAFFITFFLSAIIPSEKTMYLIMGSEVSEEVIQSETGLKVQEAIQKKLDEYLDLEKVVTNERD